MDVPPLVNLLLCSLGTELICMCTYLKSTHTKRWRNQPTLVKDEIGGDCQAASG